jgi:hypothetical protein
MPLGKQAKILTDKQVRAVLAELAPREVLAEAAYQRC